MEKDNKDKILRIDGDINLLIKNHLLLEKGNVIQLNTLPTGADIENLFEHLTCRSCGSSNIKLMTYETHKNNGALYYRCLNCLEQNWLFLTTEETYSANIIIIYGSHKKKVYKNEIENLNCPVCKSSTYADLEAKHFKEELPLIFPMRIVCTNDDCHFVSNNIFWNCPNSFFEHAIGIAKSVTNKSGEASIVLSIAALETYFEKAFYFSNKKNRYLCKERKINFQNISDTKKSYKNLLDIDLPSLVSNKIWENICSAIKNRHRIIHYGGFDEYYEQIEITESDAIGVISDVEELIKALDKHLLDVCLI